MTQNKLFEVILPLDNNFFDLSLNQITVSFSILIIIIKFKLNNNFIYFRELFQILIIYGHKEM